jgi:hypothetical protein
LDAAGNPAFAPAGLHGLARPARLAGLPALKRSRHPALAGDSPHSNSRRKPDPAALWRRRDPAPHSFETPSPARNAGRLHWHGRSKLVITCDAPASPS